MQNTLIISPSDKLTPSKIVGHFQDLPLNNQVENSFSRKTVTFQLHARMLNSHLTQSLKSYGHFLAQHQPTKGSACRVAYF